MIGRTELAELFDARADSYDASAMHRWQAQRAADLARVVAGERVLDVGAGTGLFSRAVAQRCPGAWLVGVDLSAGMLRRARAQGPGAFVVADAAALPVRAQRFDVVGCVAVVPYLPDVPAAMQQWRRVLRPRGRVVFSVPADGGIPAFERLRQVAAGHGITLPEPNAGLGAGPRRDRVLATAGLVCVDLVEGGFQEPAGADPRTSAEHFLRFGYAGPLAVASGEVRAAVLRDYEAATERVHRAAAQQTGPVRQRTLFVVCRAAAEAEVSGPRSPASASW